jgi:8-oxo-dGTP pyrophosphatase MutT (NUDIX family)
MVELDGGVLVDRRADDGAYAFTGGGLEDGESVAAGLTREFGEETGLDSAGIVPLGALSDPTRVIFYPDGAVVSVLSRAFVVTPKAGAKPRRSMESHELRVVSGEELRDLAILQVQRPIRDAYLAFDGRFVVA